MEIAFTKIIQPRGGITAMLSTWVSCTQKCNSQSRGKTRHLNTHEHRHRQGEPWWPWLSKVLAYLVIWCFWEVVSQANYCCLLKYGFFSLKLKNRVMSRLHHACFVLLNIATSV